MADLQYFNADVTAEQVAESIANHGHAIVRDLLDKDARRTLAGELAPFLLKAISSTVTFCGGISIVI